jgi:hypothetical protein
MVFIRTCSGSYKKISCESKVHEGNSRHNKLDIVDDDDASVVGGGDVVVVVVLGVGFSNGAWGRSID